MDFTQSAAPVEHRPGQLELFPRPHDLGQTLRHHRFLTGYLSFMAGAVAVTGPVTHQ